MAWLVTMLVIGLVTGWLMRSLTEGRGPGTMVKAITGLEQAKLFSYDGK